MPGVDPIPSSKVGQLIAATALLAAKIAPELKSSDPVHQIMAIKGYVGRIEQFRKWLEENNVILCLCDMDFDPLKKFDELFAGEVKEG